jgi:Na+/H+ antiporter NhaD/arsenite permease-like protein
MLLALAFAVTTGSVVSPIGNPQNLIVAVQGGVKNPFTTFLVFLLVPTIVNLLLAYALLRVFYRNSFTAKPLNHSHEPVKDPKLAVLSKSSLILVVVLVLARIMLVLAGLDFDFKLTYIALSATLPVLVFSPRRFEIVRRIDWHTLLFFASMFVLMESVWDSGFFQSILNWLDVDVASVGAILFISVALSQLISNVPLVALYLPMLTHMGVSTKGIMALVAGSTIAGNLSILGAASNVIIIQNAEKKAGETLTFMDFVVIGVPLTVINVIVYWLFLTVI